MSKHHGWMNIGSEPDADPDSDNCCLELEEILHYACPANGDIHPVVPGKILCFPTPAMLPPGVQWADIPFADAIPAPLLDRLEVVQLGGYSLSEKEGIARRFLLPR